MKATRIAPAALLSVPLVGLSFAANTAPLAPGKPVGANNAALLAGNGGNDGITPPVTSSTGTH